MEIYGQKAIDFAKKHNLVLCKYSDPVEDAREDLTVDEAEEVAKHDPSLIWIEAHCSFGCECGPRLVDEDNGLYDFVCLTQHLSH